jgi:hypothetical protein
MTNEGDAVANGSAQVAPPEVEGPDPTKLDFETLQRLRKAGYPRPSGVPWSHWLGVKTLKPRHEVVAMLAATGLPQADIASRTGYTQSRLSILVRSPLMERRIAEIRRDYFGAEVERNFKAMLPNAQNIWAQILAGTAPGATIGLQAKVAEKLFDRILGKPSEKLEVSHHTVAELYVFLDQMKASGKVLDIAKDRTKLTSAPTIIDGVVVPAKRDEFAEIDRWVDEYVPTDDGLGKKGDNG